MTNRLGICFKHLVHNDFRYRRYRQALCLCSEQYYASGGNRFDFFIVMIRYCGVIIDNLGTTEIDPTILRILRIFGLFFWLVFFIFAAISKALFGTVCVEGEASLPGMGAPYWGNW